MELAADNDYKMKQKGEIDYVSQKKQKSKTG